MNSTDKFVLCMWFMCIDITYALRILFLNITLLNLFHHMS